MKAKLLIIISAVLAAYPLNAFAEFDADIFSSDIIFTEDNFDRDEIIDEDSNISEDELMTDDEEAQLAEENAPWDGVSISEPPIGEDGAYEVSNAAQLAWIANQVNTERDKVGNYVGMFGKTIRLMSDIDLGGFKWTPIGNYYYCPFAGSFEGNNHKVVGLSLGDSIDGTQGGLFGCVIGSVSDLAAETYGDGINAARRITPSSAQPWQNGIGIVAGTVEKRVFSYNNRECEGTLTNCSALGALRVSNTYGEEFYAGGIAGRNNGGVITDCNSMADIYINADNEKINESEKVYAGSVVGYNDGLITVSNDFLREENTLSSHISDGDRAYFSDSNSSNGGGSSSSIGSSNDAGLRKISVNSAYPNAGTVAGGNSGVIHNISLPYESGTYFNIKKYDSSYCDDINIGQIAGVTEGGIIRDCCAYFPLFGFSIEGMNGSLNAGGISGAVSASEDDTVSSGIISDCNVTSGISFNCSGATPDSIGGIAGRVSDSNALITDCSMTGEITFTVASTPMNIGGIAGTSSAVIDSCSSDALLSADSQSSLSIGGIAGVSNNTVTDCVSTSTINGANSAADKTLYAGGISGRAYGSVCRCAFKGSVAAMAVQAYAGGIAGFGGYGSDSVLTDTSSPVISKSSFDKTASLSGSYFSGGLVGQASSLTITNSSSEGSVSGINTDNEDGDAVVAAGGLVGTAGTGLIINNCYASPSINTSSAAGVVFALTGSGNSISTSYLAPVFGAAVTDKHQISSSTATDELSSYGVYINKDISGAEAAADGTILVTSEEARLKNTFCSAADQRLNFDNIWVMGEAAPDLQFKHYSNSTAKMTEMDPNKLSFLVTLENPKPGQRVYVALYNREGVFCGTASALCGEEYINSTLTKAEFALDYSYNYWYNPKNYDENGELKPEDEIIPSEFVPQTGKVFTWNEETGMKNVSSVTVNHYDIVFD